MENSASKTKKLCLMGLVSSFKPCFFSSLYYNTKIIMIQILIMFAFICRIGTVLNQCIKCYWPML